MLPVASLNRNKECTDGKAYRAARGWQTLQISNAT